MKRVYAVVFVIIVIAVFAGITFGGKKEKNKITHQVSSQGASTQSSTHTQVAAWVQKYGGFIQTIQTDNQASQDASSQHDYALLQGACGKEAQDVSTMQQYPSIPDTSAAVKMQKLLDDLTAYTKDCVNGSADAQAGIINEDANQIDKATSEIQSATAHLDDVISDMNALSSRFEDISAQK